MQPAPTQGGVRLSNLALAGIILLATLFGCLFGSFLGGAGGFLSGRQMERSNAASLQQRVGDLERQLNEARSRPAAATPAAPGAAATPRAPAAGATQAPRPGQQATPGAAAPPRTPAAPAPTPSVFLGVRYNILNPEIAAQAGITQTNGALIGEVVAGSPAEKAGLEPGDIITDIDGRPLTESFTLADAVTAKKPGDALRMKVFRDGKTVELTATLVAPGPGAFNTPTPGSGGPQPGGPTPAATPRPPGPTPRAPGAAPQASPTPPRPAGNQTPTRPPGGQAPGGTPAPGGPSSAASTGPRAYLGVQVTPLTEAAARARGLRQTTGVVIETVMPASPAFQAGLFDGDIILAVDGAPLDANHSLTQLLSVLQPGDKVTLRVVRNGKEEEVTVTVGATTHEFNEARPGTP